MSYLVALAFFASLSSLVAALFFMLRGGQHQEAPNKSKRMARALAMRVGLSVLLFICILASWKMGWIHPTGIPPGR
jgi:formate hydrogenlyase subunit 3/multisubunit Na+/H+ antiporter MnhD subunit